MSAMWNEDSEDQGGWTRNTLLSEVPKSLIFDTMEERRSMGERLEIDAEDEKDIELLESERAENADTNEEKGDCGD